MPAAIDLTGRRYGRLVAERLVTTGKVRHWLFVCDCGNSKVLRGAMVRSGKTSSCGCLRKEATAAARFIDLTGKRIGKLTVLKPLPERNQHKQIRWECLCDCGNKTITTTLGGSKPTLSCGCLQRESIRATGASSKQENPVSRTPEYRAAIKAARRLRPEVAMAERISRLVAWALVGVGAIKRSATFDMLGYTPTDLKTHLEKQFTKGMSWENRSEWDVDHITPISSATCESDVIALNQLSNLRPLWALDNNKKSSQRHHLI